MKGLLITQEARFPFTCFVDGNLQHGSTTLYSHCKFLKHAIKYTEVSQRAKKELSDSPGLVDFAIGLVNSVFNLPDGQVMFYEEFE